MKIYNIDTEGYVTEEWMALEFIKSVEMEKEYEIFKKAISNEDMEIDTL